jgi:hypothetical protein
MPPNNSTATAGRAPPQPPQRAPTFSNLYRRATGNKEKTPKVETKEILIAKYELEWAALKEWLDERFAAKYSRVFTERFEVRGDHYVVYLPEDLTEVC